MRRKMVLLLVAALLLLMTLERKHLLPITFGSRRDPGLLGKNGLKAKGMAGDTEKQVLMPLASGNTDHATEVLEHKTTIQLGSRDSAIGGLHQKEHNALISTYKTCTKKTNLVFLKTHKTGSSTVQNIIMRFGSSRNLTFVLPLKGHQLGWPRPFSKSFVLQERSGTKNTMYNILCHHTRFHYDNIRDLMPNDTVYITIVRNPVYMYESVFTYFRLRAYFKINTSDPFNTFLDQPFHYAGPGKKNPTRYRNPMFYDLSDYKTESFLEERIEFDIQRLDKIFSVVMIADYFEESLILLKHELCWEIDDVTFFKLNARKDESIHSVTNEMAGKIYQWNRADAMLFDHFNKTLWSKLSKLPFHWKKEVEILKEKNQQLQDECIESDSARNKEIQDDRFKVFQPAGIAIKGFQLKKNARLNGTCVNMAKSEIPFTYELCQKEARTD